MVFALFISLLSTGLATATTGDTITVSASIAPARTIIVDQNQTITKIISNTKNDVVPQVCIVDCQKEIGTLTTTILQRYKEIMTSSNVTRIGIVYQAPVKPVSHSKPGLNWQILAQRIGIMSLIL